MAAADDAPSLPFPGSPVTLVIDEARVRGEVTDTSEGRLALHMFGMPMLAPTGSEAILEYVGDDGPTRLRGTAVAAEPDPEDGRREMRVRFVFDAAPQLLLRSDRVRARVEVPIEVVVGGETKVGNTRDLRSGGALIQGPLDAQIGDALKYSLQLPGRDEPIAGVARVARINEEGEIAIHFGDVLSSEERAAIMLVVFDAQRQR